LSHWVLKGLATGIRTTRYPARDEAAAGASPGLPLGGAYPKGQARELVNLCPTDVFSEQDNQLVVDYRRCVHCFRCAREIPTPVHWQPGYEWAALQTGEVELGVKVGKAFKHSIHILVVDAGDCGACLNEVKQLNNPYYNIHRLGFFITPTPREADVMLVVGPVTDHMRVPLQKAYDAMPTPKRVIAVGTCALSGSVVGPSFVCGAGVRELLPVDVEVPGQPPPPLSILHALLVAVGRKASASLVSPATLDASETLTKS
jgi:Ni,Fe-hydrogenase III small subunit/NAD-dependent dihydropyrimidine dehydrogenase PreA subunit